LDNWNPNPAAKIAGMAPIAAISMGIAHAGLSIFNYRLPTYPITQSKALP
jgi:hypothetical protein